MQLQMNQISRDWTILHAGRKFYVNYTDSDGQTLALCNRNNWEVWEETDEGTEELDVYFSKGDTPKEQRKAENNSLLKERLIMFCIENWDSQFMQEIKAKLQEQKGLLGGILND
ncbi:MAG: hypothetical protein ISS70_01555 [Phycisphaerae bacterium]|nr:hypothetical protein [Phycisphaerae bacterium]